MTNNGQEEKKSGPNLQALGLKSSMEVIDILGLLRIDGEPVIKNDQSLLDPKEKARAVIEYFVDKHNLKPGELPYVAAAIKTELKSGRLAWRK